MGITSARDHPRGTLNVVALRATTDRYSINVPFCFGVALSAAPTAAHKHRTCSPLRGCLSRRTEARGALVGDREDSTANRMT